MALSDLTGTRWVLNNQLSIYAGGTYSVKLYTVDIATDEPTDGFNSEAYKDSFSSISIGYDSGTEFNEVRFDSTVIAYGNDTKTLPDQWLGVITIPFTITGGTDATNSALIAWLEANATQQQQSYDVTISYKGSQIASMDASGTKTLLTEGKYCEDDIVVQYTRYSPNLQSKTVSPTTSSRTITADSGYDGLSQVTVNAIAPTKAAQTYTPTTTNYIIRSGRWLTGDQTIKGDANLVASNIKKDVQIFGVTGSYEGSGPTINLQAKTTAPSISAQVITPDDGYDGLSQVSVAAISPTKTAQTYTPTTTDQTIASGRWLTGAQTIKGDANLVASNIKKNVQIFGVTGSYEGSGGGGSDPVAEKDVNFIDYDGTLLYSYTASEFANLSALPDNPNHSGLIAQGWNWTLANAKTYVASYGKLWIGQMYITESGDTEIDIELHAPRLSPYLGFAVNGTVEVDWGDGTAKSTVTGTSLTRPKNTGHVYTADGSYTIKIHVVSGSFSIYTTSTYAILSGNFSSVNNNKVYANNVQRVRIGSSINVIGINAFNNCCSLASITIPRGVTSISNSAFNNCCSLASITIPSSVTSIGISVFTYCYSLASITIPSGVSSIRSNTFQNCYSLASITIPSSVTSIGDHAFYYCYSLASITIPSSVTSISNSAFQNCNSLASITIPSSVTSIGDYAFSSCYSLASITIPSGVTSIGTSAFQSCNSLASITISSGVTSISTSAFNYCYSLASITIPSGVTSIGTSAFSSCYGVGLIRFEPTTPPTVANSNAWTYLPTDCVIHIPAGTLSAYTSATNYPSSSTYTYVED